MGGKWNYMPANTSLNEALVEYECETKTDGTKRRRWAVSRSAVPIFIWTMLVLILLRLDSPQLAALVSVCQPIVEKVVKAFSK